MWPNPQDTANLVTFAEEIFNGKLFCVVLTQSHHNEIIDQYNNKLTLL